MKKYVLTVTLNPAIDKMVSFENITSGEIFDPKRKITSAGGKGLNISRTLKNLKNNTFAMGIAGGKAGQHIRQLLKKEGIRSNFVYVNQETRTNVTILNTKTNDQKRIMGPGPKVRSKDITRFKQRYKAYLKKSCVVVLAGRNALGASDHLYAQLIRLADRYRIPCVLDTSGDALKCGLKARPLIINPNLQEAQSVFGGDLDTIAKIKKCIHQFHNLGISIIFITLGSDGAICSDGKEIWHCQPPKIKMVNDVGCGDAFLGGFVHAYLKNKPFKEALRFAAACGTANCLEATPGLISQKNVLQLFKRIRLKKLPK